MNMTLLQNRSVCVWEPWDTREVDSQTSDFRGQAIRWKRPDLRTEIWELRSRDGQISDFRRGEEIWETRLKTHQTSDDQKIKLRFEVWGVEMTRLFHHKETRCLQLPVMPNEFGVCMVYGRCCTRYDGARHTWVSRHFCSLGNFLESWVSLWFSAYADFFAFPEKVKGEKAVPLLNSGIPFLHFLWPSWKYMECFLSKPRAFSGPSTI